jgi:hypothetical protein
MAKTNYGQIKKQKEAARKARQQKKLDRRQARPADVTQEEAGVQGEQIIAPTPRDESVS